jgi:hypothetical protein
MKLAVLLPLGPSPTAADRFDDSLNALSVFAPSVGPVVVINDGNSRQALTASFARHGLHGIVLDNPRLPGSSPWRGGLTCGLAHGFAHLRQNFPDHHILRMDDDALVVRPFLEPLARLIASDPRVGLIGSVNLKMIPDASPTTMPWSAEVMGLSRPFVPWPRFPRYRSNLSGVRGALRRLILRARKFGYTWACHANGGAYLVTAPANRAIGQLPELSYPGVISTDEITEDVFFALLVHAAGLRLLPQQSPGDIIASCWQGLIGGPDLSSVWSRENAILHSLKDHHGLTEKRSRDWFRERRQEFAQRST